MSGRRSAVVFVKNVGKIFVFLGLLPAVLTYFHLQEQTSISFRDLVVVGGKDAPGLYGRKNGMTKVFTKILEGSSFAPDVVIAATAVLKRSDTDYESFPYLVMPEAGQSPCLHTAVNQPVICKDDLVLSSKLQTSSHGTTYTQHTTLQLVTSQIPATCILIALNVILAFLYWNNRVPVNAVAKMYGNMMRAPFEIWRSLSGATAHFNLWHIGLNMMSLSALGKELEGLHLYSSIAFFFYNFSLIPMVSVIWLGLQWMVDKYGRYNPTVNGSDPNRPTVGYSGVLFAWMVVASLEQQSTCPVVFLPSLCFQTYTWGPVKFSWGPLVQLIVMQIILPHVSLTGHLAGIVAGFLLHWGFLPIRNLQPAILVPALYLFYLRAIRKIIFTPPEPNDVSQQLLLGQQQSESSVRGPLLLFRCQLVVLFCSLLVLGPFSSLNISFALTAAYWYLLLRASMSREHKHGFSDCPTAAVYAKGYILAAVLVLVTDAMTVGSWYAFYLVSPIPVSVMILRGLVLLMSMSAAQVYSIPEDSGIFEWTLGYTTLQPCKVLAAHPWLSTLITGPATVAQESDIEANSTTWTPFAGAGRRLGGDGGEG